MNNHEAQVPQPAGKKPPLFRAEELFVRAQNLVEKMMDQAEVFLDAEELPSIKLGQSLASAAMTFLTKLGAFYEKMHKWIFRKRKQNKERKEYDDLFARWLDMFEEDRLTNGAANPPPPVAPLEAPAI